MRSNRTALILAIAALIVAPSLGLACDKDATTAQAATCSGASTAARTAEAGEACCGGCGADAAKAAGNTPPPMSGNSSTQAWSTQYRERLPVRG